MPVPVQLPTVAQSETFGASSYLIGDELVPASRNRPTMDAVTGDTATTLQFSHFLITSSGQWFYRLGR